MKRLIGLAAGSFLAVMMSSGAQATPVHYGTLLTGMYQNPPIVTLAYGIANVWIDAVANTMRVDVTFNLLAGPATAAHIHCCVAAPGNAGVATPVPSFPGFPIGATSAGFTTPEYDQTFDMTLASSYNPAFITANGGTPLTAEAALFAGIMDGTAYFNIHDTVYPAGEIRGFLQRAPVMPAPEPATLALAGFGLLAAFGLRKRRAAR